MCKYKDVTVGIKKLDFSEKRGMMAVYLTDGREVLAPVSMFPEIRKLRKSQREDYMIMDDQYFTFNAISKIFSIKDVLSYNYIEHKNIDKSTITQEELRSYRLNSSEEPTDEMLHAIMLGVQETARQSTIKAEQELNRRFAESKRKIEEDYASKKRQNI